MYVYALRPGVRCHIAGGQCTRIEEPRIYFPGHKGPEEREKNPSRRERRAEVSQSLRLGELVGTFPKLLRPIDPPDSLQNTRQPLDIFSGAAVARAALANYRRARLIASRRERTRNRRVGSPITMTNALEPLVSSQPEWPRGRKKNWVKRTEPRG